MGQDEVEHAVGEGEPAAAEAHQQLAKEGHLRGCLVGGGPTLYLPTLSEMTPKQLVPIM